MVRSKRDGLVAAASGRRCSAYEHERHGEQLGAPQDLADEVHECGQREDGDDDAGGDQAGGCVSGVREPTHE